MDMTEEVMGSNDHLLVVNKGKRTKRQRPYSPVAVTLMNNTSSSSSTGEGSGHDDHEGISAGGDHDHGSLDSTTVELGFAEGTDEEQDMANCLILLAQGQGRDDPKRIEDGDYHHGVNKYLMMSNRKLVVEAAATTTNGKQGGFYVYKCKTCNRCFPSFQALGGHRASHKKPKPSSSSLSMVEEKNKALVLVEDENQLFNHNSPSLSLHLGNRSPSGNNKSKVHECSICGSEFSSGQALGGHMRRHRPSMASTTTTTNMDAITSESEEVLKKERNVLSLDLNLPAPEDDRDSKFPFTSKQQPLVFSASALVDCHY